MANNFKGKAFTKILLLGFDRPGYATTSKFSIERKRKLKKNQRKSVITIT